MVDTKTPVLGRGRLRFAETRTRPLRKSDRAIEEDTRSVHVQPGAAAVRLPLDERYIRASLIGHGGMGTVYEVTEQSLFRKVAMKVLRQELRGTEDSNAHRKNQHLSRMRFIEEAQINGQLEHPNIVPVYELGIDDDGTCFFTMKRVHGRTLDEFLREENVPEDRDALYEALQIFLKVCDALAFAHSRGVVHRDVKPSNIMVGEHGQVYLMDWGIALVLGLDDNHHAGPVRVDWHAHDTAADGSVIGTLQYMSPEQAGGDAARVDPRSDVFSLGAVLYRMITGRAPYAGETPEATIEAAKTCAFPAPESLVDAPLPVGLLRAAAHAMTWSLDERTQTVDALKEEIEEVLRGRWRFPTVCFEAGETILREGEQGQEAYIVRSGRCVAYRMEDGERVVLGDIHPGEVFGETALLTSQPRSAHVEAAEAVELFVVSEAVLSEELGLDSWRGAFVRTLGTRFSERSSRLNQLERELSVERARRDLLLALVSAGGELPWDEVVRGFVDDGALPRTQLDEAVANAPFLALEGEEDARILRLYASKGG